MNWTTEKPSDTGWYWFQANSGQIQLAVEVTRSNGKLVCTLPILNFSGDLEAFDRRLTEFNRLRRNCDVQEVVGPKWSDERLPIPKIHL